MRRMALTKEQIWSGIVLLIVIGLIIGGYCIADSLGWFDLFSSQKELQAYVLSFGVWAPLAFFSLQIVQVIISPIPGNVTTVLGGVLFGFWPAAIMSVAAVFFGSVAAFLLAKKLGKPLVMRFLGKKATDKYMRSLSSRQHLALLMMFLLPFFPDDALCLVAGLSAISLPHFMLLVILTRPWGLVFSALIGSGVIYISLTGWFVIGAVAAALMFLSIKWAPQIENWMRKQVIGRLRRIKRRERSKE